MTTRGMIIELHTYVFTDTCEYSLTNSANSN